VELRKFLASFAIPPKFPKPDSPPQLDSAPGLICPPAPFSLPFRYNQPTDFFFCVPIPRYASQQGRWIPLSPALILSFLFKISPSPYTVLDPLCPPHISSVLFSNMLMRAISSGRRRLMPIQRPRCLPRVALRMCFFLTFWLDYDFLISRFFAALPLPPPPVSTFHSACLRRHFYPWFRRSFLSQY